MKRERSRIARIVGLVPRPVAERAQTLRRDLTMVARSLVGHKPHYLVDRPKSNGRASSAPRWATGGADIEWRSARVRRLVRETPDATTVVLDDDAAPDALPGQFLTVELEVDGETLRRGYSLSHAPGADGPTLTVKRIPGGRASGFIHERLAEGDALRVRGPSGKFTVDTDPDARRTFVLVAGGSGITPVHAIVKAVLRDEPHSRVLLIYGNRSAEDVIFADALRALAAEHGDRLTLDHVLEDTSGELVCTAGRLDADTLAARLDALEAPPEAEHYVCGPEPMRLGAMALLRERGVPEGRLHQEIYVRPEADPGLPAATSPLPLVVRQGGITHDVIVPPGNTVLEASLAAGVPLPFSCTMGGCAACRVRLVEGEVQMDEPNCLSDAERRDGWVLACVSHPRTRCEVEVEV